MTDHLYVALGTVVAVEISLRLGTPGRIRRVLDTSLRASRVMASRRISDHWKERALPRYSGRILVSTLVLALSLLLMILAFLALGWGWDAVIGLDRELASLVGAPVAWAVGLGVGVGWTRIRPGWNQGGRR